ncbi:hypothetical protein D3Z58_02465 [Clostridiaceae bacterium]|nr:hypothetical protein [Clostridiaceae bacterium]
MPDINELEREMTEKELSDMWKEAIEKSLQEVGELRKQLNPVPFSSPLWEKYHGAYGDVREDVAFLFCPKELVPKMDKIMRLDFEEKEDDRINFDNLCENLSHQLSFYDATYLVLPYFVLFLEKKRLEEDFRWQMRILLHAGVILSTELPGEAPLVRTFGVSEEKVSEEIQESYQLSKEILREKAKEFITQYIEEIKEEEEEDLNYFATGLLAILGDSEAANRLMIGGWEQVIVQCPECDYYDEDMEINGFGDIKGIEAKIKPASSVIGKWDGKNFDDTYVWFSNLVHDLGIEDEWKLPYYYGTYTCPECGSKGVLMDWMKASE